MLKSAVSIRITDIAFFIAFTGRNMRGSLFNKSGRCGICRSLKEKP
jgi:hypothetical protein